jgi:YegS/Rv2252/BmrU family lipid kinase
MKRAILLYNTQAGRGKIERKIAQIVNVFHAVDCDLTPVPIEFGKNPFDGREDVDLAVVAGGDGTINYVVNGLMRKGLQTTIAVIPAGTANDFAGAIGMSRNPVKAAEQIVSGVVEQIDCGKVEQMDSPEAQPKYFVNIFSFGIFTTTSQHTPEELKHRIGRMAYGVAAFEELRKTHGIPLTITSDAETFYYPTLMGLVFNGETAGRLPLARKSSLRDGVFDCLFLRKRETTFQSAFDMLFYLMGIRTRAVKYLRTSSLMLVTPLSEDTDVDGQRGGRFPMKVTCLHGALRVVCPREE